MHASIHMQPCSACYHSVRYTLSHVLSRRDNARAEFVTSLGLGGTVLYNPGAQRATLEVDDWGPAAALNSVLWRIYPEVNLAEGENISSALHPSRAVFLSSGSCWGITHTSAVQ